MAPIRSEDQTSTFILRDGQLEVVHDPLPPVLLQDGNAKKIIDCKYEVHALIGEGGMGSVYLARHILLNKDVALKTLRPSNLSGDYWERFQREVKSVANLNNPNVIQIFDFGVSENNSPYYTMELLNGLSLEEYLERNGCLSISEAIWIFSRVAAAMSAVHALGVIHRDLKPANIFLVFEKERLSGVKVLDFGIAKLNTDASLNSQKLTATGLILGSPLYMSPEQSIGLEMDQRTDLYSFGCILYEALVGRPPFKGASALQTMHLHQTSEMPPFVRSAPDEPADRRMELLLRRLLAKTPKDRIQTFEEVAALLSNIQTAAVVGSHEKQSETAAVADVEPRNFRFTSRPIALSIAGIAVFAIATGMVISSRGPERHIARDAQVAPESKSSRDFLEGLDSLPENSNSKSAASTRSKFSASRQIVAGDLDRLARQKPQDVELKNCTFDNQALSKLSKLQLNFLNLNYSNFDDIGAKALGKEIGILNLRIQSTHITDRGLRDISQIKSIRFLDLRNTETSDTGLSELAKLPSLATLRLADTNVSATGVRAFCQTSKSIRDLEVKTGRLITEQDFKLLVKSYPSVSFADKGDVDKATAKLLPQE